MKMTWNATQDEQVREHVDDLDRGALPAHSDDQAFTHELVNDVEHPELAAILRAILDEIVAPDVAGILRSQPDAGSIIRQRPTSTNMQEVFTAQSPESRLGQNGLRHQVFS